MANDEDTPPVTLKRAAESSAGARFTPPTIGELNTALPQYEFVEVLGVGGMGAVYKARQPKLDRFVAIKILPPIPDDELGFAGRFEREAQAMAKLSHPHIVAVHDFGETADGQLFFVMEYVEGADLHKLIAGGQLTLDHFHGWIPQICDALQYAHDHGIVHRDIKPANILIDTRGRVKMADFGLAKWLDTGAGQTELTQAHLSLGTPDYAAPEQIDSSRPVDWRADIYSLGVVMYQMLTGVVPRGAFSLPSEKIAGLDKRLDDVVLRAMQSEPENRFQHASDISTRLTEILNSPPGTETENPSLSGDPGGKIPAAGEPAGPRSSAAIRKPASLLPSVLGLVAACVLIGLVLFKLLGKPDGKVRDRVVAAASAAAEPQPGHESQEKKSRTAEPGKPKEPAMPNGARPPGDNSDKKPGASPKNDAGEPSRPTPPGPGRNDDRPRPPGGDRGPNLNAFRDKLGSRRPVGERFENLRRTHANLSILRRDGRPLADEPLARPPQDLKPVVQIVIGEDPAPLGNPPPPFAAALLVDGTVAVWGSKTEALAAAPAGGSPIVRLAAGTDHLLALRADGTVSAWGANAKGQCDVPTDLGKVTRIAAGRGFSVALGADGAVFAWGDPEGAAVPADLGNEVAAIATGTLHTVALRRDGKVIAWGANVFGQSDVPPIEDATAVACTFAGGAALTREGRVIGWGTLEDAAPAAPPANPIVEIEGLGDVLLLRDETGRLHLHGLGGGAGSLLRQIPRQVSLAFSTQLGFLYKPATEAAPEPPPPVPATTAAENPAAPPAPKPETEASVAIDDLQRKFEDAYLAQVSEPFQNSVGQLDSFYLGALAKHQSEAAESSRLEDAVAFRDETARIEAGEAMPETDDPALPAALLELRLTYRRELSRHEADRQVAEAGLLEKYDAALGAIQDKFTQEQKLDDALEVKAFREHRAPSDGAAEIEPKA